MRRAATMLVAVGLTVTGLGAWSAAPRQAQRTGPAGWAARGAAAPEAAGGLRAIEFGGYILDVPASWPVYRLDRNPSQCVRYDRHAVYLGTPGANQDCPAHLAGHVATISVQASAAVPSTTAGPMWSRPAPRSGPARNLSLAGGVLLQDAQDQQFRAIVRHPGLTVNATYAGDASLVARIIGTLRRAGAGTAAGAAPASGTPAAGAAGRPATAAAGATWAGATVSTTAMVSAAGPARAGGQGGVLLASRHHRRRRLGSLGVVKGFDACTAPSLKVMRNWRPYFGAVNIYLGGPEVACGYGNLSAAWVRSVLAMGWALIPTYVGPQAPCTSFESRIVLGHAQADGRRAALDAIRLAAVFGLRRGAPLYDDMEYYNPRNGICRRQVMSFLNGWTRELHARGYRSGVYSSASAGIHDLSITSTIYGERLVKPNSVWFALWDGRANLEGGPYLPANVWTGARRIKQYQGGHRLRLAGSTLNIDSDLVGGAVYR